MTGINEESKAIERMMKGCIFGGKVFHFDSLASTQTEAKRLAALGEPEGTVVTSRIQTAGYGRKGDAWHSDAGGLWFSLILHPKFLPSFADQFSIRLGFAIAQALQENLRGSLFEVKAPNDVLAVYPGNARRKVCGILLDGSVDDAGDNYQWMILGVGINVNNELPSQLKETAGTLEELSGKPVPRMPVLKSTLERLADVYTRFGK